MDVPVLLSAGPVAADISDIVSGLSSFVWGPWCLIPLLLGTGLYLTIRLGGLQFRRLGLAFRLIRSREDAQCEGDISHYQALATALAATVGIGNISGVALAIGVGGPGALFWMWMTALVGMASKYTEAFLGVRFREKDAHGRQSGGPQVYLAAGIRNGFGRVLAVAFAIFTVIASFGIGNMTQSNTVALQLESAMAIPPWVTGMIVAVLIGAVTLAGVRSIGNAAAAVVPVMIVIYVLGGLLALALNIEAVPAAIALIFTDAFTGTAAVGGFAGSIFIIALQQGVSRGLFSNESGLGSAAIVAAAARSGHPVRQGLVSMTQTFIDTIIVVSITGLVIVTSGVWEGGAGDGSVMTAAGFSASLPGEWGGWIVTLGVVLFSVSTILGWSYYGERCATRLFGIRAQKPYRVIFALVVFVGAVSELDLVWTFSDLANGLMALPNLIGLIVLSGLVARETKAYFGAAEGASGLAKRPRVPS